METTLHLSAVRVERQGRPVLQGLDLAVHAGEVFALLGGNGAGKTTTLGVLLGFVRPSAGQVAVGGLSPAADPVRARGLLAYLPENVALYPYLTGLENLRYFGALAGRRMDDAQAARWLEEAGLPADAHRLATSRYSKGMRQKVGLAIAHAKDARAMLLDEPTSGLDPAAAREFARRVRHAAGKGMAVLMATHDLANVLQVADTIGVLHAGRLAARFPAREVDHGELERRYLACSGAAEVAP